MIMSEEAEEIVIPTMTIETDQDGVVTGISTSPIPDDQKLDTHNYTDGVETVCGIGGTYINNVYTEHPSKTVNGIYAWREARSDLVNDDVKEIALRDAKWKRCVFHGHIDEMTLDCWSSLMATYPKDE